MKPWVPYEIAEFLKKVGFNERCIYHYKLNPHNGQHSTIPTFEMKTPFGANYNSFPSRVSAPLWDEVIEWFIRTYDIHIWAQPVTTDKGISYTGNWARNTGKLPTWPEGELAEGLWLFFDVGETIPNVKIDGEGRIGGFPTWQRTYFDTRTKALEEAIKAVINLIKGGIWKK